MYTDVSPRDCCGSVAGESRRFAETVIFPRKMTDKYCGEVAETTNPRENCAEQF